MAENKRFLCSTNVKSQDPNPMCLFCGGQNETTTLLYHKCGETIASLKHVPLTNLSPTKLELANW
jgi:hypothetical protein